MKRVRDLTKKILSGCHGQGAIALARETYTKNHPKQIFCSVHNTDKPHGACPWHPNIILRIIQNNEERKRSPSRSIHNKFRSTSRSAYKVATTKRSAKRPELLGKVVEKGASGLTFAVLARESVDW